MSISFRVKLSDEAQPLSEQTRALIVSSFPKICRSYEQIEANHRLFWSFLPGSYVAFAFGGTYHIPLGIWVHAWKKGIGVTVCPDCGGQVNFTFTNGAMSMGWSKGYCSKCGKEWNGHVWSVGTWAYLKNEIEKNKKYLSLKFKPYEFKDLIYLIN